MKMKTCMNNYNCSDNNNNNCIATFVCNAISQVNIREHVNVNRAIDAGHKTHISISSNALITVGFLYTTHLTFIGCD